MNTLLPMLTTQHDKIVILESLADSDRGTGSELSADLQFYRLGRPADVPIESFKVHNKGDFFGRLARLADEARSGIWPIVHLECHGLRDHTGILLADDSPVTWSELSDPLAQINIQTRCSLLFSVAACYGAHGVAALANADRAPFWAILAPRGEIWPQDLYGPYLRFYAELLSTGDGDRALERMTDDPTAVRSAYGFMACDRFFAVAFAKHLVQSTSEAEIMKTAAKIRRDLMARGITSHLSRVQEALVAFDESGFFNARFRRFIMADIFPENASRFPLSYGDVEALSMTAEGRVESQR
jgi:hypothetical protein